MLDLFEMVGGPENVLATMDSNADGVLDIEEVHYRWYIAEITHDLSKYNLPALCVLSAEMMLLLARVVVLRY